MPDQSRRLFRHKQRSLPTLRTLLLSTFLVLSVSACDMIQQELGLEDPVAKAAKAEAEGRAVGGACRQSGRAIEDCYAIYSWLPKAPIYEGWRDMDAYMRDNKLETITPQLPPVAAPGVKRPTPAPAAAAQEAAPPAAAPAAAPAAPAAH